MKRGTETNNQRAVQAVRRMVKAAIDEDGRLGAAAPKAAIGKTRGVAFYNSNGDIEGNSGELPPEADTDTPKNDDGSQTKERNYKPITDDYQEGDKADEFEAYDCATGQKLQIDLAPMPGQEYPAPEGWEDANTPPVDPTYEEGYWWKWAAVSPDYYATLNQAFAGAGAYAEGVKGGDSEWSGWWVLDSTREINGSLSKLYYQRHYFETQRPHVKGFVSIDVLRGACGSSTESYCNPFPSDLLLESEWPANNITALSVVDGKFTASEYDPDAPQVYKDNPQSSIEVCDGLGSRYELNALANGQAMITKLMPGGGIDELGQSLLIDSNGIVKEKISNKTRDGRL